MLNFRHAAGGSLVVLALLGGLLLVVSDFLPLRTIFFALLAVLVALVGFTIAKGKFVTPAAYARHLADEARARMAAAGRPPAGPAAPAASVDEDAR